MAEGSKVALKRTEAYTYVFIRKKGSYQQMDQPVRSLFASAARRALIPVVVGWVKLAPEGGFRCATPTLRAL